MIRQWWEDVYNWAIPGIGSNLTASAVLGIAGLLWAKREFVKLHRKHEKHEADMAAIHDALGIVPEEKP